MDKLIKFIFGQKNGQTICQFIRDMIGIMYQYFGVNFDMIYQIPRRELLIIIFTKLSDMINIGSFIWFTLLFYSLDESKTIIYPAVGILMIVCLLIRSIYNRNQLIYRMYLLYSMLFYIILSSYVYIMDHNLREPNEILYFFLIVNLPSIINMCSFILIGPPKRHMIEEQSVDL
jgi:hypothetical protein